MQTPNALRVAIRALSAAALTIALFVASPQLACAELSVGKEMPALSLMTDAGSELTLAASGGSLAVEGAPGPVQPRIVFVHFFQVDCLQCRAQLSALDQLGKAYKDRGVLIVGVAYRRPAGDLLALRRDLKLELVLGTPVGGAGLAALAAGDASFIADRNGVIRFVQAGFGEGDQARWREVVDALLEGMSSPHQTVARERLAVGDSFPVIRLPSLRSGKPMSLVGSGGRLQIQEEDGQPRELRGAIFFFSRY